MTRLWPGSALVVLVAIGCGGSGTTAAKACADLAAARCNKRMSCSGGADITLAYGTMQQCLTRETLSCTVALDAPSTGNNPDLVEKCVAAFANYSCTDFYGDNPPADCIVAGPRAAGAPCAFSGQCASTYCNNNKTSNCGTCGDAPALGASCANSNCSRQQDCDGRTQTCYTPGVLNAACDNDTQPCGPDLACVGNVAGAMGTCKTPLPANAQCSQMLGLCDGTQGYACQGAATMRTCTAIGYGVDGADCGTLPMGVFAGCAAGACFTATGLVQPGQAGKCKADAADGAACDLVLGPNCLPPARCVASGGGSVGSCTVPSGASCM